MCSLKRLALIVAIVGTIAGCASVDVTKTAKGTLNATNPNEIEVLMTRPDRKYQELGVLNAHGYGTRETAKMHNALRNKAAALGADAVVVTDSGQIPDGWGGYKVWSNAVAVKWDANPSGKLSSPSYR